ncbi:MAG: hypothetical protein DDG60_07685 [Anaerolineae bacterium]|nr:MAG: hypothetical protein DDG60_07685 [Anaerolineae bacterium]
MLSTDQVQALAPDAAAFQAAQRLKAVHHWVHLGRNEAALWGECRGSAAQPYQVKVDVSNLVSACTCPSRKLPCKHALGLMLLAAEAPDQLTDTSPPDWVSDWLAKRTVRPSAKTETSTTERVSRQKDAERRAARRQALAETGLETLETWLHDLLRHGLAFAQNAPPSFWREQTARLVDAQLPGAARLVRELSELPGRQEDWPERFLLGMARLHLLIRAWRRLETLPPASQADVRALLGWSIRQDELHAGSGLTDDWLVTAQTLEEDETGLRTRTTWLWSRASRQAAKLLHFAFKHQPFEPGLLPGSAVRAEAVYYPSAVPVRAILHHPQPVAAFLPAGWPNTEAMLEACAEALGANPWLEALPVVLEGVIPIRQGENWLVVDADQAILPLSRRFASGWALLALSGGHSLTLFGLWDGASLHPMAAWHEGRYVHLEGSR